MIHGTEVFGLNLSTQELDDRNYRLVFAPYKSEQRFFEFDGIITLQCLFEKFHLVQGVMESYTDHTFDRNELDKREKEADILFKNGGFVVFLLHAPFRDHIYESMRSIDCRDTDLVKRFLNYSSLYRHDLGKRYTALKCLRDEFLRFFELYGAAWSTFDYFDGLSWRNLALMNGKPVSMVIADRLFFIPCLLPEQRSERKEEFYRLLADAVVTCVKKLRVELPPWADEFLLPSEQALVEEQAQLSSRLEALEKERSALRRFKRVLVGDGDALVDDVVYLLTDGFGFKVNNDENFREDIRILGENREPLIFGEVKGTTRGVKREYINQADSHRERSGLPAEFPTILIINTHTKNARSIQDKDQEIAPEQVKHAVNMHVLLIRTLDLLNLLVLIQKARLSQTDILTILRTESGWLRIVGDEVKIQKE